MTREGRASRVAVLVPLYKESITTSEEFSFRNTLKVLSKHDIHVICPARLSGFLSSLKAKLCVNFKTRYFADRYFSGVAGYNSLLKSRAFYKSFDCYEYLLIVQTDALVISDQLDEWCNRNYSYIGAPWFKGFDCPVRPLSFLGVGNGGFSLRKVQDFIRVLSYPRYIPNVMAGEASFARFVKHRFIFSYSFKPFQPLVNEDAFWGLLAPRGCNFFTVPAPEAAISFAFEAEPEYLYELNRNQLPFGCHAWEKYNLQFWRKVLSERGLELP